MLLKSLSVDFGATLPRAARSGTRVAKEQGGHSAMANFESEVEQV